MTSDNIPTGFIGAKSMEFHTVINRTELLPIYVHTSLSVDYKLKLNAYVVICVFSKNITKAETSRKVRKP
jgi:hypothetical protein